MLGTLAGSGSVVCHVMAVHDGSICIARCTSGDAFRVLQLQRLYLRTKVGECLGDVEAQILMCTALARIQGLQLCDEDGYDSLTHSHGVETEHTRL